MPIWTKDDIARIIISVGRDMGISPRGIVIGLATGLVESNLTVYGNAKVPGSLDLPHDAVGSDGFSVGVQQEQVVQTANGYWWGPVEVCQDPTGSTRLFFGRLKNLDYNNTANSPGSYAQAVQGSAFPVRYDQQMGAAQAIYDRLSTGGTPVVTDPNRPDFNEYPVWSNNSQSRNGTTIDAIFLHTNEGDQDADSLAHWLGGPVSASYHLTISQAADGGVTVCDVVNTDLASWSVLSANNRSINYCFAGSKAAWSRADWLKQSKAIDVAAYLAVLDCKKYGIPTKVVPPPYTGRIPGVSDHAYVTKVLKDGTHTDVGNNFPWDVFTDAVNKYAGAVVTPPVTTPPVVTPPAFVYPPEADMIKQCWEQLFGYQGQGFADLLGKTADGSRGLYPVEAIALIKKKVGA